MTKNKKAAAVAAVAAVLAIIGLAAFLFRAMSPIPPASAGVPQDAAIEARYGIRVSQVGVTADGGLVDFRYIVLDPDKALDLMGDEKNVPTLVVEDGGAKVNAAALMPHRQDMKAGRTYFMLYRNSGGVIKQGARISVQIGEYSLQHVPVL